jgi:hypothetical protein
VVAVAEHVPIHDILRVSKFPTVRLLWMIFNSSHLDPLYVANPV